MADSVGKISLDVDIQSSLDKEIKSAGNLIGNQLSKSINSSMQKTMGGMQQKIKDMLTFKMPKQAVEKPVKQTVEKPIKESPKVDFEATRAQIAQLEPVLNNVNAKLDHQHRKLAGLKESYNNTFNEARRSKLEGQILNTESAILRLTKQSDDTAQKIWKLDDSLKQTGNTAEDTGKKVNTLGDRLKRTDKSLNNTRQQAQKTGNALTRTGQSAANMSTSFQRAISRILKQVFVFALIYKAISSFNSYMGSALRTNDQFMHSLYQVRSNLLTAFQPIYQAILPALQTFMNWLATATAYIASFISVLFGTTYKQSFKAAQGLNAARSAMDGYGGSAKKAAKKAKEANKQIRELAGFDEINTISQDSGTPNDTGDTGGGGGGGGAGGGGLPPMVMPDIDTSALDKKMQALKDKLKNFFKPTTDSLKKLWKDMKPFRTFVATGVIDFYERFLKPVGTWVFHDGLPRFFNALGEGIKSVNWKKINESLVRLWDALAPFAIRVGEGLLWFWENALVPLGAWYINSSIPVYLDLLSGAIELLNAILDRIKGPVTWMFENFLLPLAKWQLSMPIFWLELLASVLSGITNWIKDPVKAWNDLKKKTSETFSNMGKTVSDNMKKLKESSSKLAGEAKDWIGKKWKEGVKNTKEHFGNLKKSATDLLKGTRDDLGKIATKIKERVTTPFNNARTLVTSTASDLRTKAVDQFNKLRDTAKNRFDTMKTRITSPISSARTLVTNTVSGLRTGAVNHFNSLRTTLSNTANNIRTRVTAPFTNLKNNIINAFQSVKSRMGGIWSGIYTVIRFYINRVIAGVNTMIGGMNKLKFSAPDWVPKIGGKSFGINIPRVPYLAKGGIIDQPTLAMVGEAGKEAVMPLENNTGWISNLAGQIAGQLGPSNQSNHNDELLQKVIDVLLKILDAILNNDTDAIFKIGETEFGRATIKAINKTNQQAGKQLLKI